MKNKNFTLYKIYYSNINGDDILVYIGRTKQPLNTRLHGHFFKTPMVCELDINRVSRVEYAQFTTEADMNVMEIVLINRFKPALNKDDKAKDELTIAFPDVPFSVFECPHIDRWKKDIEERERSYAKIKKEKISLIEEHRNKRREIFSNQAISADEKSNLWGKWLVEYYEPAMDVLQEKEDFLLW